jgi:hypothetical protein
MYYLDSKANKCVNIKEIDKTSKVAVGISHQLVLETKITESFEHWTKAQV